MYLNRSDSPNPVKPESMLFQLRRSEDEPIIEGLRAGGSSRRIYERRLFEQYFYLIRQGVAKYRLDEEESFDLIAKSFDDSSTQVRNAAARALCDLKTDRAARRRFRSVPAITFMCRSRRSGILRRRLRLGACTLRRRGFCRNS